MIGYQISPIDAPICAWCGDDAAGDHAPCALALRNLDLGYCTACGGGFDVHGQQHDDCMVFLTGRPDLLEPGPEDQAVLGRLVRAIEASLGHPATSGGERADAKCSDLSAQARWN